MMNRYAGLALMLSLAAHASAYELQPPEARATGSSADAIAIGDVDGDGRDDVVLATTRYFDEENDYKIFVYLQRKGGTLAEPVKIPYPGTNFTAVALADLDGDAAKEIIIGDGAGLTLLKWNKLERLRRMRTYEGLTPYLAITNVAILDVDRDGHPDVVGRHGRAAPPSSSAMEMAGCVPKRCCRPRLVVTTTSRAAT
jgi:hypothetical protein